MIDLKRQIVNDLGEPSTYQDKVKTTVKGKEINKLKERPVTLHKVFKHALLGQHGDCSEKFYQLRYDLFMKIRDADECEFTKDEKKLLTTLVSQSFDIVVFGQITEILNITDR